jgi:hypothetical protein
MKRIFIGILLVDMLVFLMCFINNKTSEIPNAPADESRSGRITPQVASEALLYESTSEYPPLFSVVIPKGTTYYQDGEPLTINTNSGLTITICTTCQLFVPNCGGLSDGNESQGGCAISDLQLGPNVKIGAHFRSKEPTTILGYFDNYKNSKGNYVSVNVISNDNRKLNDEDKKILFDLLTSLK